MSFLIIFALKRIGFSLPPRIYKYWLRSLLSLLQDKVIHLSLPFFKWQVLQDLHLLCVLDVYTGCTHVHVCSCTGEPRTGGSIPDVTSLVLRGRIISLSLLALFFLTQKVFDCYVGTLLTHVQFLAHQDLPQPLMPSSFPLVSPKTFTSPQSYFSLGKEHAFLLVNVISPACWGPT